MSTIVRKRGGSKVGRQQAHNKLTGKYTRQRVRTEANKKKRALRQREIRAVKRENRLARMEGNG